MCIAYRFVRYSPILITSAKTAVATNRNATVKLLLDLKLMAVGVVAAVRAIFSARLHTRLYINSTATYMKQNKL